MTKDINLPPKYRELFANSLNGRPQDSKSKLDLTQHGQVTLPFYRMRSLPKPLTISEQDRNGRKD